MLYSLIDLFFSHIILFIVEFKFFKNCSFFLGYNRNLCLNYIYGNPIKHGYVKKIEDWKYSSLHRVHFNAPINTAK